ncbi:MAG: diaminopimelate decarboxylase [Nitrospirae bacterium]|nr:diaminopimelate decarboxylase [Nitrospirota bacterium]
MDYFNYRRGKLFAEDVDIQAIAEKVGTPFYVYSHRTITRHINAVRDAFSGHPHIVCYALKANSNGALLRIFAREGFGGDIVSGGELFRARKAGIPSKKIVYAGVGKTGPEIRAALKAGILMFNVESNDELRAIDRIAASMKKRAPVALRVNPDIDAGTHPYITTGMKKYKFGIPVDEALESYRLAKSLKNIEIVGVQKHIGSQLTEMRPFVESAERIVSFVERLRSEGIGIKYLDMGGGLGIRYDDETPPEPHELLNRLIPLVKHTSCTLIIEPGRSIIGNAGMLVTSVLYLKSNDQKNFVIVDAGMNDLVRPSLYDAFHKIEPVAKKRRAEIKADIVGPICESGDFIARDRMIQEMRAGELLAVRSAGAYGFSMSSNYNSRPRPAEVLVDGDKFHVIRKRERIEDLIAHEQIPAFLK